MKKIKILENKLIELCIDYFKLESRNNQIGRNLEHEINLLIKIIEAIKK